MPAVVILAPLSVLVILIAITQGDMDKAYVEIVDNVIIVVDYYFGLKTEKTFSIQDIATAETLIGYSMRVRGYRYSNAGGTYIVFRDKSGKYMFKVNVFLKRSSFFVGILNNRKRLHPQNPICTPLSPKCTPLP